MDITLLTGIQETSKRLQAQISSFSCMPSCLQLRKIIVIAYQWDYHCRPRLSSMFCWPAWTSPSHASMQSNIRKMHHLLMPLPVCATKQ